MKISKPFILKLRIYTQRKLKNRKKGIVFKPSYFDKI